MTTWSPFRIRVLGFIVFVVFVVVVGWSRSTTGRIESARDFADAFKTVARSTAPSVVNVTTVKRVEWTGEPFLDPWFRPFGDWFGEDFLERFYGERDRPREFEERGLGSGVVVTSDGYILTNDHVIRDADELTVKLLDGEEYDATVVGTDPRTDLAVLKIDGRNLAAARFGNSDEIEVGEWVLAIGNPFGLDQTVTAGIVSAKGRANVGLADYEDFLQTDAAINPGNSGGPLVDLYGDVIGINTAIVTRSGGYQGVGFAIPARMAQSIMNSLIETGTVRRGWIGAYIQNLEKDLARSFGYEGTEGVLISDLTESGPADEAGLEPGDIVVGLDGEPVGSVSALRNRVASIEPGSEVELSIIRDGEERRVAIEIGELPEEIVARRPRGGADEREQAELGLTLRDVPAEWVERLGLETASGALVVAVELASPAARAGVQPGDVIHSVNGRSVADTDSFVALASGLDLEAGIRMQVSASGFSRFVLLKK
jgi:serine protease Do